MFRHELPVALPGNATNERRATLQSKHYHLWRLAINEPPKANETGRLEGALRYESSLFFESDLGPGSGRFRRPLLSILERQCLSQQLTSSVEPSLALWNIEKIDEHCEGIDDAENIAVSRGPFGAFRISQSQDDDAVDAFSVSPNQSTEDDATDPLAFTPGISWSPNTQEAIDMLFTQPPTWELWEQSDRGRVQEIVDGISLPDLGDVQPDAISLEDQQPTQFMHNLQSARISLSRSITPVSIASIELPQSAWVLLKHYLQTVLKSFTPFRHSKTPWHILFVPLVKNCLAGLALQENVDHASLCVFYGTLSISASSLSGTSKTQSWLRKVDVYRQRAEEHCKASLESAYNSPKTTKYKTQLMALLTMAQLSIVSGMQSDTEYFLIEAEKFIRMRGLNRRKSRKVRLLHHCYAYERIFFESTSRGGIGSSQYARHARTMIESSGARAYSKDSLSFRLPTLDNLETDMLKVKDQEMGENDLHLEVPGRWPSSQYDEIFGISESYVFLVSLIIRLAKEKEGDIDDGQPNNLSMKSFTTRAKSIERCIKQQRPQPSSETDLDHIIEATHHAVVIYFYRRIHDVDAFMLQCNVSKVRDALLRYESASIEKGFATLRLIWPAFIAACEAEDASMQTFFTKWFETASQQSGLKLFDATMFRIEKIWQEERSGSGASYWSYMAETEWQPQT
ncbi:Arginine metabolism regulation protein II [Pseudocercospora fuligena]|uniref:Arginine metabolism regulation protein II n=1 Tax=Pseudocercospora fuligena TaxID=685502 RepID=A0A8H6RC78_9PEZI|nr:Arginine metabolism regulation protein II [Pseudocercospora fuligena]